MQRRWILPKKSKALLGKSLIAAGVVLILFGLIVQFFGKLPGDIYIKKGNFSFYFPLASSILISIILSAFFYLFFRK
jgi:hypothetical protein